MNRYILLAATSFILAVFAAGLIIILNTKGVSYSAGITPEQFEGLSYQEGIEFMRSQGAPMSYAQAVEFNITSTFFWWQVFLLSCSAAIISVISLLLTDKWLGREST